jgi:hypothetical protein
MRLRTTTDFIAATMEEQYAAVLDTTFGRSLLLSLRAAK